MEMERRLRYKLEEIDNLNNIVEQGRKAMEERDKLRLEIVKMMESYVDVVNERYGEE